MWRFGVCVWGGGLLDGCGCDADRSVITAGGDDRLHANVRPGGVGGRNVIIPSPGP